MTVGDHLEVVETFTFGNNPKVFENFTFVCLPEKDVPPSWLSSF